MRSPWNGSCRLGNPWHDMATLSHASTGKFFLMLLMVLQIGALQHKEKPTLKQRVHFLFLSLCFFTVNCWPLVASFASSSGCSWRVGIVMLLIRSALFNERTLFQNHFWSLSLNNQKFSLQGEHGVANHGRCHPKIWMSAWAVMPLRLRAVRRDGWSRIVWT